MKMLKIWAALAFLAATPFALAEKVVVVDMQQAIMLTDLAKERQKAVVESAEFTSLISEEETLRSELEALAKKAQSEGLTWSEEQKTEHQKNIEIIQGDRQRIVQKVQISEKAMMQGILSAVKQEYISQALLNIVKAEGADVVLRAEAAVYTSPDVNITLKLAEELNKALSTDKK